jgi:hypothetical protein
MLLPDLFDDNKVLAVAMMEQPIRFTDAKRERRKRGIMHGCRCFRDISGFFRYGLQVLDKFTGAKSEKRGHPRNHVLGVVEFTFAVSVCEAFDAYDTTWPSWDIVAVRNNAVVVENFLGYLICGAWYGFKKITEGLRGENDVS